MNDFAEAGLHERIIDAIEELGFEKMTPIQAKTIPHLLSSNQDVIALAQTGTGKTAAFGLPTIHLTDIKDSQPQTLILSPTRELCLQITNDLNTYAKYVKGLGIVAIYGGASIENQIRALRKNAQIVVGTPGRVKDLINRKRLLLGNVQRVILDEADEMLTMGFKDDLEMILGQTPEHRQTLLFSATMSKRILPITKSYMSNPLQITVAQVNVGASNVRHVYYKVYSKHKYQVLKRIADSHPNIYGIVFCRTRRDTQDIANKLLQDGYNADVLNGDLSQGQRDEVMKKFRKRQIQILVATDVAARGLDVEDLTHVINFNLPDDPEVYTHRSGRTGRAGKSGVSMAIINTKGYGKIRDIERYSKIKFEQERVPSGLDICQKQLMALVDKIDKVKVNDEQIDPFMPAIYEKLESLSREELIKHFVSAEFNRFLDYYKNAKDINIDSEKKKRDKQTRDERRKTPFKRLFINLGSKQDVNPKAIISLINEALDSGDAVIGKIEILKKFSFFEIEESVAPILIETLHNAKYRGVTLVVEVSQEKPYFAQYFEKKKKKKKGGKNRANRAFKKSEKSGRRDRDRRKKK